MSFLYLIIFLIGGLPIVAYPVILMANVMSFAGHRPAGVSRLSIFMMKVFVWSTTLYPITYFFALYKYKNTTPADHHLWAGLIILHWLVIIAGFVGWDYFEKNKRQKQVANKKK